MPDEPATQLLREFENVRARTLGRRLSVWTQANPGRQMEVEAQLVADVDKTLWLVGPVHAERLDSVLFGGLHVDPDEAHLGRFRITVEAV